MPRNHPHHHHRHHETHPQILQTQSLAHHLIAQTNANTDPNNPTYCIINQGHLTIDDRSLLLRRRKNNNNTIIYNAPGSTMKIENHKQQQQHHHTSTTKPSSALKYSSAGRECKTCFRKCYYGTYCSDCLIDDKHKYEYKEVPGNFVEFESASQLTRSRVVRDG
ncbi:hypothetical protein GGS20DRAFT_515091 [Poronia punctata]|nr:hypothetical protein GGS20DRAFT_515091 [Poronia punctata]